MKSPSDLNQHKNDAHKQIDRFDRQTGLPNRVLFGDRLRKAIAQSKRWGNAVAVVRLDLDGLDAIEDHYGDAPGKLVLKATAHAMKRALRPGETLAHIEGNRFAAVLPELTAEQDCMPSLIRLLEAAAEPVSAGGLTHQLSASIGVAFYPQETDVDADLLVRRASQAMYQAKAAGKNLYRFFDPTQDDGTDRHPESVERIRQAVSAREFELYYQPKVNMSTGEIVGAEALIRWQHPQRGLMQPGEFLPVIENHPLAVVLGEWVIGAALAQMERWLNAGLSTSVSVNVGVRQLQQPGFGDRLATLLAEHPRIKPSNLELEIRETDPPEDVTRLSNVLTQCRETGVTFALDDFGSGHLALVELKRLPVDVLKIDLSFVRDILESPEELTILEGVLGLATAFRRQTVAEGVETVEQGLMLLQMGCKLAQGYGIARPMPADEFSGWAAHWHPDPRWAAALMVSVDERPLLHAGVEHRAWAAALEGFIKGDSQVEPKLSRYQCQLGAWLYAEGPDGRSSQPVFQPIVALHWKIHALATIIMKFHHHGRNDEATERLGDLKDLVDKLADLLNAYGKRSQASGVSLPQDLESAEGEALKMEPQWA